MDAFELFNEHQKPTGIFVCGKCRSVPLSKDLLSHATREEAEACCRPPICEACGKEHKPVAVLYTDRKTLCQECRDKRWRDDQQRQYQELLEKAEDVTATYAGPVYAEGCSSGDMGEGYFSGIEVLRDRIADDDEGVLHDDDGNRISSGPEWAFCCTSRKQSLSLDNAIESLCDDGYEDMADRLTIPQSLKDGVSEFNTVNADALVSWNTDYKRKVRVRP